MYQREWEDFGRVDPRWAVLTDPTKKGRRWTDEEFFAEGDRAVALVLRNIETYGVPERRGSVLDFGCGAGRCVRAFATHFDHYTGVDVAESMLAEAQAASRGLTNCTFVHNTRHDLRLFDDASFDVVFSVLVLQHVPSTQAIQGYLREFVRVLAPGGLITFQLPSYIPLKRRFLRRLRTRLAPRRRAYALLRRLGVSAETLQRRGWAKMDMAFLPLEAVTDVLTTAGATMLGTETEVWTEVWTDGIRSVSYHATKAAF